MADEIVEYLVDNFSAAEIEAARGRVFTAHLAGLEDPVVITSSTMDGSTATGVVSVTPGMREKFMSQCRMAISRLNGEATTTSAGLGINWAARRLES